MVASTEKSKALTSTQEGLIAGLVLLFFGLLYGYLNPWNSEEKNTHAFTQQALATGSIQRNNLAEPATQAQPTTAEMTETTTATQSTPIATVPAPVKAAITGSAAAPVLTPALASPSAANTPETLAANKTEPSRLPPPPGPVKAEASNPATTIVANQLELAPDSSEAKLQTYLRKGILETPVTMDGIHFESNTTTFTKDSAAKILLLAALLEQYPAANFLITTYTTETTDTQNSDELSLMRANALGVQLVNAGVQSQRITIMGMGTKPSPDKTVATSNKSQRLEISVIQ